MMADGSQTDGASGAGRLCYELPTLNIMGRQLESIVDHSRTLQQLGVSGNVMMRLGFKNTGQPLEDAMKEISQYFSDIDLLPAKKEAEPAAEELEEPQGSSDVMDTTADTGKPVDSGTTETAIVSVDGPSSTSEASKPSSTADLSAAGISVFSAPSSSQPAAASTNTPHNDEDYVPTAEHARSHQANLNRQSRNRRLLNDSEVEKQRQERDAELAKVTSVTVRFRFPDQMSVQNTYGQDATLKDLYHTCRTVMQCDQNESFELHVPRGGTGGAVQGAGVGAIVSLKETNEHLIRDLGWSRPVLVTVGWAVDVSKERRAQPALKQEYRQKAEELKAPQPIEQKSESKAFTEASGKDAQDAAAAKESKKRGDKEARLKKLMGLKK